MRDYVDNGELAREYLAVVGNMGLRGISYRSCVRQAGVLRDSEADVQGYFRDHGTLRGLGIPDVTGKTKKVLQDILENGVDEVLTEIIVREPRNSAAVREHARQERKHRIDEETARDECWSHHADNAARQLEDR